MSNLRPFSGLANHVFKRCETTRNFYCKDLLKIVKSDLFNFGPFLSLHTTPRMCSMRRDGKQRAMKAAAEQADRGTTGENSNLIDAFMSSKDIFPTYDLPNKLIDGVPFKDTPITNIKISHNNTILSLNDKGEIKLIRSCGIDGFKNCRKGTNLAAQMTGLSFGLRAIKKGFQNVRVVLKGLGPGREGALKGLELSGLKVISITDNTPCTTSQRPKKPRRL